MADIIGRNNRPIWLFCVELEIKFHGLGYKTFINSLENLS